MIHKLTLTALLIISFLSSGVAQKAFNFQAYARDKDGQAIVEQTISIKAGIHELTAEGNLVYEETHSVKTSNSGLFKIQIGRGETSAGSFDSINWSTTHYISIAVDPKGGSNYTDLGAQEILAVPYAVYTDHISWEEKPDFSTISEAGILLDHKGVNTDSLIYNSLFLNLKAGAGYNTGIRSKLTAGANSKGEAIVGESFGQNANSLNGAVGTAIGTANLMQGLFSYVEGGNEGASLRGLYTLVNGTGQDTENVGVRSEVISTNSTAKSNIGIYARADGATKNLAGKFIGNVIVEGYLKLQKPGGNPADPPEEGSMYYDESLQRLRIYIGGTWYNIALE